MLSLFNFNNEDFEEEFVQPICQCEECSVKNTLMIVEHFTEKALKATSVEHLQQILYEFAQFAKIQGIKEYLFESVKLQADTLINLDDYFDSVFNQSSFDDYGESGFKHWQDRM